MACIAVGTTVGRVVIYDRSVNQIGHRLAYVNIIDLPETTAPTFSAIPGFKIFRPKNIFSYFKIALIGCFCVSHNLLLRRQWLKLKTFRRPQKNTRIAFPPTISLSLSYSLSLSLSLCLSHTLSLPLQSRTNALSHSLSLSPCLPFPHNQCDQTGDFLSSWWQIL